MGGDILRRNMTVLLCFFWLIPPPPPFPSWPAAARSQPVAKRWKGWNPVRHRAAKWTKGSRIGTFKHLVPLTGKKSTPSRPSAGRAADEGLVGELERQEGAAGALQFGHQRRPGWFPHQIPPAAPGLSGPGRPEHRSCVLSPQGTASYLILFNCLRSDKIVC